MPKKLYEIPKTTIQFCLDLKDLEWLKERKIEIKASSLSKVLAWLIRDYQYKTEKLTRNNEETEILEEKIVEAKADGEKYRDQIINPRDLTKWLENYQQNIKVKKE